MTHPCSYAYEMLDKAKEKIDSGMVLTPQQMADVVAVFKFCDIMEMEEYWENRRKTHKVENPKVKYLNKEHNHNSEDMAEEHSNHYLTEDMAKEWVMSMHNADGTKGEHWDMNTTSAVGRANEIDFSKYSEYCFYVVMNMMYSDYYSTINMLAKTEDEKLKGYLSLAKNFMYDEDALPLKERLYNYHKYIVKH